MKTLKTIQTLAKIGKILSKIVFIFCIVGGIMCVVGIAGLALIPEGFKIGGTTVHGLVEESAKISMGTLYTAMATGIVFCAGEAILSRIAGNYFTRELADGTPFTFDGARALIRLGIFTICIPIATSVIGAIVYTIMKYTLDHVADFRITDYVSVGLGVMFIVTGLICRYGAEVKGGGAEVAAEATKE